MIKEVSIAISPGRIVIKCDDFYKSMNDVLILVKGEILSVGGMTEEELKNELRKAYATEKEEKTLKLFDKSKQDFAKSVIEMSKKDLVSGSYGFWDMIKDDFQISKPFDIDSYSYDLVSKFFLWISLVIKKEKKGLFDKFSYNIQWNDFNRLENTEQQKLKAMFVKKLPKCKSLTINGISVK